MAATKQIIALGGGGFSMEPKNLVLDDYFLRQTFSRSPKVCFLGTASGALILIYANFINHLIS